MSILFFLSCLFIFSSYILCFYRILLGPQLPDRVVGLDLLTNLLMASLILFGFYKGDAVYVDIVVALALVMFLNSTMYARYLSKTKR